MRTKQKSCMRSGGKMFNANVIEIENLIDLRRAYRLSRRDVSQRLGCVHSTIYKWEKGYHSPSPFYLKSLRRFVSCYPFDRARSGDIGGAL